MRQRLFLVALTGLVAGHSAAAAEQGECPERNLSARVHVEEPPALAARIKVLVEAGGPGKRSEALQRQLEEAGCEKLERRTLPQLQVANLVCTLPGRSSDVIVVGTSPEHEGEAVAALLPALVEVLRREPREHTFQIVAFGREQHGAALGARSFAGSLDEDRLPALFLHLGFVGFGAPRIEQGTHAAERCTMQEVAGRLSLELGALPRETRTSSSDSCSGGPLGPRSTGMRKLCDAVAFEEIEDRSSFLTRGIRFAGLTARVRQRTALDPVAHYSAYRFLAAYLAITDRALGAETSASP